MFTVNENCIGCGVCAGTCPDVFDLNADGLAENILGEVPAELVDDAEAAMAACPIGAIVKE